MVVVEFRCICNVGLQAACHSTNTHVFTTDWLAWLELGFFLGPGSLSGSGTSVHHRLQMFPTKPLQTPPNHRPVLVQRQTRHLSPVKGGNLLHVLRFYFWELKIRY